MKIEIVDIEPAATRRQAEITAVRKCLQRLGMPETYVHDSAGAPISPFPGTVMSVTHCRGHAAVCVADARSGRIGIDMEHKNRVQLESVMPRILSPHELLAAKNMPDGYVKAWTAKEAVYKAAGIKGLDFARDICLECPEFDSAHVKGLDKPLALKYMEINSSTVLCIAVPTQ